MEKNIRICAAFAILLLFAGMIFAEQSSLFEAAVIEKRTGETLFQSDVDFKLDTRLSNASSGGSLIILTPGADPNDLPDEFTMCPGMLDIFLASESQWASDSLFCIADYPGNPVDEPLCPQCKDEFDSNCYPKYETIGSDTCGLRTTCLNDEMPWLSPSSSNPVQWNSAQQILCSGFSLTSGELLECMRASQRSNQYEGGKLLDEWAAIQFLSNINCDYQPLLNCPLYPNQQAQGALVCNGEFSVNGNTYRLEGMSPSAATRLNFQNGGTYTLAPELNVDECMGVARKLPIRSYPEANWQYYFYRETAPYFPAKTNTEYTITVLDQNTCALTSTVSPAVFSNVAPGDIVNTIITIENTDNAPIRATGVRTARQGWLVAPATEPPPNGFGQTINPGETQALSIIITAGNPADGQLAVEVQIESTIPLCDGDICTNTTNVTIDFSPSNYSCNVSTNLSLAGLPNEINAGEDILLSTTCYRDSTPISCDTLQWSATGFADKVKLARIGTPKETLPPVAYSNGPITTSINAPYNDPPIPEAMLYTYNLLPNDISPSTGIGNIFVTGNTTEGGTLACSLDENIKIRPALDLVPIIEASSAKGDIFAVTFSVRNNGDEPTRYDFYDWYSIESLTSKTEKVTTPVPAFGGKYSHSSIIFECPHPGLFKAEMEVDSRYDIIESNEKNNYNFTYINCGSVLACPDLT
ncbi:hypothetical protein COU37_05455 [Candidatus Micrarchaeota archaeon CG10_big_fil_rev_8_21_14_0_10_45_29]|nr:MAG: hypothetical protein COU37_05455 [Candidatus Micrarchaeota archaeon CG10_big_fil_rev_8_21_14_0_10_45_29]